MLPLIGAAPQHHGVLDPDAHAADMKADFLERLAEVQPFCVRVEDIGGRAFGQMRHDRPERCQKELIEPSV